MVAMPMLHQAMCVSFRNRRNREVTAANELLCWGLVLYEHPVRRRLSQVQEAIEFNQG